MNLPNPLGIGSRLMVPISVLLCMMRVALVSLSISVIENMPIRTGMNCTPSMRSRFSIV